MAAPPANRPSRGLKYHVKMTTESSTPQETSIAETVMAMERDYLLRLISRCNCWVLEAGVADKFNPDE